MSEAEKQLKDTMKILEDFFYLKCQNSDLIVENPGHKGFYYLSERTAKELKYQLVKFKTRL